MISRRLRRSSVTPFVLVVNPSNPKTTSVKSVADLVALGKSQKIPLTFGSAAYGNLLQLAAEQFVRASGFEATHIPYRGGAPMQVALLAGEIDFTFDTLAVVPQVEAGRLRALAVTENERWRDLPDVPTVYELGLAKAGMSLWIGLLAPANTPQPILARLHQAMIEAGKDADARKRLEFYGRVEFKSPTDFQSQIMQELSQNEIIVREANIKIE